MYQTRHTAETSATMYKPQGQETRTLITPEMGLLVLHAVQSAYWRLDDSRFLNLFSCRFYLKLHFRAIFDQYRILLIFKLFLENLVKNLKRSYGSLLLNKLISRVQTGTTFLGVYSLSAGIVTQKEDPGAAGDRGPRVLLLIMTKLILARS